MNERFLMCLESIVKTSRFLRDAIDEDVEKIFSWCAKVENLEGMFSGLSKANDIPNIEAKDHLEKVKNYPKIGLKNVKQQLEAVTICNGFKLLLCRIVYGKDFKVKQKRLTKKSI